jgi:hypothetical protein
MIRPPIFYGKVEKGKIKLDNPARFTPYLQNFEGKRVELVLRERRTTRSEEANAYYWAVVVKMVADKTGFDSPETHEALKKRFHVTSTSKLKTKEFWEYIAKIQVWAVEFLDLAIPDANQVDY